MPKKVLIADDNDDLRSLLSHQLGARGYQCLMAADGAQAVEKCRTERPDIVLLDVLMPGMDGAEAGAILKEDPATRNIPVIFLTALVHGAAEARDAEHETEITNRYTLPKSVSLDDLVKKIEKILQG